MGTRRKKKSELNVKYMPKGIDRDEVYRLHKEGMRNGAIAKQLGCYPSRITEILKSFENTETKHREKKDIDRGKVWALYRAHWPLVEIALEMQCEKEDIITVLKAG